MQINRNHGTRNLVRRTARVLYIVVHYTGSGTSRAGSANANCVYFGRAYRGASAHYFIDDGGIWEYADPAAWAAWHVGDGHGRYGITNANSVGIEVCSSGADFTKAEQGYLRDLVRSLMQRFGVPASRVVRHYDASRKCCPKPYAPNGGDPTGAKWRALHAYVTGGPVPSATTTAQKPAPAKASKRTVGTDGLFGPDTADFSEVYFCGRSFGDRRITGQPAGNRKWWPCNSGGIEFTSRVSPSTTIRRMQEGLIRAGYPCGKAGADGYGGYDTTGALQARLRDLGYDIGPGGVDHVFGHDSCVAYQRALNDRKL